jgi:hypothetical protein
MHILQDKDSVILIMYNQSNVLTCLKCKAHLIIIITILKLYLDNLILFNQDNTLTSGSTKLKASSNTKFEGCWIVELEL